MAKRKVKKRSAKKTAGNGTPRCGLCGKTENLTHTSCCDQWVCDDESEYVLFSFDRNSCSRNHRRHTLCGFHDMEEHDGDWQDCKECREEFETEMYADYGTNNYNFVKLKNPPKFKPTRCAKCKTVISLAADGYFMSEGEYICEGCFSLS
jgi:hypothetical protein